VEIPLLDKLFTWSNHGDNPTLEHLDRHEADLERINRSYMVFVDGPYNKYSTVIISRMRGGYNKHHAHFKY
jgi:hypothetical protein